MMDATANTAEEVLSDEALPSDRVADLVEFLVCSVVHDEESVQLDLTDGPEGVLIEVGCAPQDAGRIIGRRGHTIKSIRTLARALGSRLGTSVEVEVLG